VVSSLDAVVTAGKCKTAEQRFMQLGGRGLRVTATTAAQRARTRGFATPAFAGCAYVML